MTVRTLLRNSKELLGRTLLGEGGVEVGDGRRKISRLVREPVRLSSSAKASATNGSKTLKLVSAPLLEPKLHRFYAIVNDKFNILTVLLARQCRALTAHKIRRSVQITELYRNLGYDTQAVKNLLISLRNGVYNTLQQTRLMSGSRPRSRSNKSTNSYLSLLFGAVLFSFDQDRITDEEMTSIADDVQSKTNGSKKSIGEIVKSHVDHTWEKVIDRSHLHAWRRPTDDSSYVYEYKVCGTWKDIPARAFYNAQVDLSWRKEWDNLVIKLDVVEHDPEGSEVVQWITYFPYPMYSREYIYMRRYKVDSAKNLMVIAAHAIDHPGIPESKEYVRVNKYKSNMVIKPHTTFDENGFDYVLTYMDDPKSSFPGPAYRWMAKEGVPRFVDQMHDNAKKLHEIRNGEELPNYSSPNKCPM